MTILTISSIPAAVAICVIFYMAYNSICYVQGGTIRILTYSMIWIGVYTVSYWVLSMFYLLLNGIGQ